MGVFNRAIPKYIRNPITGSISVEPTVETVHVDDAFDPVLNKAVREQYMSRYGNPVTATVASYADLVNNALLGNQKQGGTMLPGIGILSSFGRTMDKAGDVILGSLTEGVKGATFQGIESPFYNIFVEDEDYSGQRFLAAAANSMAKMANAPEVTEEDFGGVWTVPALGIDLATDPSILGGTLKKVANGTGSVAEIGQILQDYDDIMAKFAMDATAPGLRYMGKKFSNKIHSIIDNLSSEQELNDAVMWADDYANKTAVDYDGGLIPDDIFTKEIQKVKNIVEKYKQVADQDVVAQPLKQMLSEVEDATKYSFGHTDMSGNIFESSADVIAHQVNARGVMGAGLAKQISKTYPEVYAAYKQLVNEYKGREQDLLGTMQLVPTEDGRYVANIFGQLNYGKVGKFTDEAALEKGLTQLSKELETLSNLTGKQYTIALPKGIGSGLGGGNYDTIQEAIARALYNNNVELWDAAPLVSKTPVYDATMRRLHNLEKYPKVQIPLRKTGANLTSRFDTNRQAISEIIDYLDKSVSRNRKSKSYVEFYRKNPQQLLKDLKIYKPLQDHTEQSAPTDIEISTLAKQIADDKAARAEARAFLKTLDIEPKSNEDALDIMWELLVSGNAFEGKYISGSEEVAKLRKAREEALNIFKKQDSEEARLIKALETIGRPANYGTGTQVSKQTPTEFRKFGEIRGISDIPTKKYTYDSDINTMLLEKLPSEFTEEHNVNSVDDFINLLNSDDPDVVDALENLFGTLVPKEGFGLDSVKVSQSMSKHDPEILIRVANNIQHTVSEILTEAVDLGLVSAKDISEHTLDELFDEIHSYINRAYRGFIPTGNRSYDTYKAFSYYAYNKEYLKQVVEPYAKKVWNAAGNTGFKLKEYSWEENKIVDSEKSPWVKYDTFEKFLEATVSRIRRQVATFESKGDSFIKSPKAHNGFLDEYVFGFGTGSNIKFRGLANQMLKDEVKGIIPEVKRKPRFPNISSRSSVDASKIIEEFKNFSDLLSFYESTYKGDGFHLKVPVLYVGHHLTQKEAAHHVKKLTSHSERTEKLKSFMQFLHNTLNSYEHNIGSKLGGRLPDENVLKYTEYDRSSAKIGDAILPWVDKQKTATYGRTTGDTSIGYSRAVNEIFKRVEFDDPMDIYKIMHEKFNTSVGTFSLADLGVEITHLPKAIQKRIQDSYEYGLTKSVKFKDKNISFVDFITDQLQDFRYLADGEHLKLSESNFKHIISEKEYRRFFMPHTNLGYNEVFNRLNTLDAKDFTRETILEKLSAPSTSLFNNYITAEVDPKVMYLNRLRSDLGSATFESVSKIITRSNPIGEVVAKVKIPPSVKLETLNRMYSESLSVPESKVIEAVEELPDETFEQLVTNEWKIYQESDLADKASMINKMFPNETPITAAELKLYEQFGDGGSTPIRRAIKEKHPKQTRLFDILAEQFRLSIVAKQDRDAVLNLPKLKSLLNEATNLQSLSGSKAVESVLTLRDKQRGSVLKGTDFLSDLTTSGVKIIAYNPKSEGSLITEAVKNIKYNIELANKTAGSEVIKFVDTTNSLGQRVLKYYWLPNEKGVKKLFKSKELDFNDVVFEKPIPLTPDEVKFLETNSPITKLLDDTRDVASEYYTKIGFTYNDPNFFKHSYLPTPDWNEYISKNYYMDLDEAAVEKSKGVSEMILDLGLAGELIGQFGTIPMSRIFEGNISKYAFFQKDLSHIVKSTFSKGVFANEKFQTTMSIFDNDEFRLGKYCKTIDDVKSIVGSTANARNLTIASIKYNENGMISGFTKYDNTSDKSLAKALEDKNAIVLPTHIFASLDKFCKHKARMSNKAYAFVNRYLTSPFKVGILLNPGFILGNMSDAYLKQFTTMANKYGTSVEEEIANVADAVRTTIYLNNKFTDIYDVYLKHLEDSGINIPANYKISSQVASSKVVRDNFIQYINSELHKDANTVLKPILTEDDINIARVWIYLNAIQPTEGVTRELAGDLFEKSSGSFNYSRNAIDRLLYGLKHYKTKDITTQGFVNNLFVKGMFGISEWTESMARSSAILNDLKHQGIDLAEFGKILGGGGSTEFRIKMVNAINAMHNSNFDYNSTSPLLDGLESFVPFPTFWLKNIGYWFDMFINHPQYIDAALTINEGLWANEDTEEDEFKADAKARGAVPMSAFGGRKLSKFFKGIYKPSPLQSMFSAFNAINNPIESLTQRVHPLIQGAGAATEKALNEVNLTTNLFKPDDIRYRPYNTKQYQPNINLGEEEFNPLAYTAHKLNPFDRLMNTYLRTPGKVEKGEAQLSDFLPSVFQPDFSKK